MRSRYAKWKSVDIGEGLSVIVHEIRPCDVIAMNEEMIAGLDGLTSKEVMDTIAERQNTAGYYLFMRGFDVDLTKIDIEKHLILFPEWTKVNKTYFDSAKPGKEEPKTRKKYMRVEDYRENIKTMQFILFKMRGAGYPKAEFYGWSHFVGIAECIKTAEKQQMRMLANAFVCSQCPKAYENLMKEGK